jgi:hypothetical protein
MNKNKIILSSIGGVAVLVALVVGYLAYDKSSEKSEKIETLDGMKQQVRSINGGKIKPAQDSVDAIEANRKKLSAWRNEAFAQASRGDIGVDPRMTPDALKQLMVGDARALSELPGAAAGKFVKPGFDFGFKGIVAGSDMPAGDKLELLQRQWADVKMFAETIQRCGAVELEEVVVDEAKAAEPEAPAKGAKGRKGKKVVEKKPIATAQGYSLKFLARPFAIVGILNAFTECDRFVVMDDVSYVRATDALASSVGGKENPEAAAARPGGRRRRRGGDAAQENAEEGAVNKKGLVVDPATDVPFTVTMKITVYDFGTKAEETKEVAE